MFGKQVNQLLARAEHIFAPFDQQQREAMMEFAREIGELLGNPNQPIEHSGPVTLGDLRFGPNTNVAGRLISIQLTSDLQGQTANAKRLGSSTQGEFSRQGDNFQVYDKFDLHPLAKSGQKGWASWDAQYLGGSYVLVSLNPTAQWMRGKINAPLAETDERLSDFEVEGWSAGDRPSVTTLWNPPGGLNPGQYVWSGDANAAFGAHFEPRQDRWVLDYVEQAGGS